LEETTLRVSLKDRIDAIIAEEAPEGVERMVSLHIFNKRTMWRCGLEILRDYPELKYGRGGWGSSTFNAIGKQIGRSNHSVKSWVVLASKVGPESEDFETYAEEEKLRVVDAFNRKLLTDGQESENEPPEIPEGKYKVIYSDPPWQYANTGFAMSAAKQYPTLSTDQLRSMGEEVRARAHDDCILFLWATNPLLKDALLVMESWGFAYKTNLVWVKKNHTAGFYVYGKHELLLIGVRGKILPEAEKQKSVIESDDDQLIIEGENTVHSKKPEIVYQVIESMYPVNHDRPEHIEIFARQRRPGWEAVGNEI